MATAGNVITCNWTSPWFRGVQRAGTHIHTHTHTHTHFVLWRAVRRRESGSGPKSAGAHAEPGFVFHPPPTLTDYPHTPTYQPSFVVDEGMWPITPGTPSTPPPLTPTFPPHRFPPPPSYPGLVIYSGPTHPPDHMIMHPQEPIVSLLCHFVTCNVTFDLYTGVPPRAWYRGNALSPPTSHCSTHLFAH